MPLMRALVLEYQDDVNTYDIGDQYLLGSHLMVCPVTTKGAQTRVVYLPEGTWFDYWTGTPYEGGQYISVTTPLDTIPIFAKGGAIVPMQPVVNYIGEQPVDTITLDIFPEGSSEFVLYDDDGKSLAYQQEAFATTTIHCEANETQTSIQIDAPEGTYSVPERTYTLKIHTAKAPDAITSGSQTIKQVGSRSMLDESQAGWGWFFSAEDQLLYIQPAGNSSSKISIEIKYTES